MASKPWAYKLNYCIEVCIVLIKHNPINPVHLQGVTKVPLSRRLELKLSLRKL